MALEGHLNALAADWEAGCWTAAESLVPALLRRDQRILDAVLATHTAAQLAAVQHPLPLYHAAALAGWVEGIAALAAAGVPPPAANVLVQVAPGGLLARTLRHASFDPTGGFNAASRLGHCYSAVGTAAAMGHVQAAAALLAMGASATAGREAGALPACRAAALYGRTPEVQGLLALLAAAGGQMNPQEAADCVWYMQQAWCTRAAIPAVLQQLTVPRLSLDGLSEHSLQNLANAALYSNCAELVEVLPPGSAAVFLPAAAASQDPALLLRLLRLLGRPLACSLSTQQTALTTALGARQPVAVTALLAAGVQPAATQISQAICSCQPTALRAMLAVAHPPEPPLPFGTIDARSHEFASQLPSFVHQALLLAGKGGQNGTRIARLQVVEALVVAGYRLHPYHGVTVRLPSGLEQRYQCFDPAVNDPRVVLSTPDTRELRLAATHPTWSPAIHSQFPPAFRHACRALLLAAQRSSAMQPAIAAAYGLFGLQPPAHLGSLPADALLLIMQQAAYPLSLWDALDCMSLSAKQALKSRQLAAACRHSTLKWGGPEAIAAHAAPGSLPAPAPAGPPAEPAAPAIGGSAAAAAAPASAGTVASAPAAAQGLPPAQPQPVGMAPDVADAVAAFKAALGGDASAAGSGTGAVSVVGLGASDSASSEVPAVATPEELSEGLAALSFSTHSGPFVFGGSG